MDYGCLVVDMVNQYKNSLDKIYAFKADDHRGEKYFVGSIKNQLENMRTKNIDAAQYYGV